MSGHNYLTALKALAVPTPEEEERQRKRELHRRALNKMKACDAADCAARAVPCTCAWDNGDHASECDTQRAWDRAYDQRLDELEEGT